MELVTDPEITSDNFHAVPTETPTEGVGIVEAPRGTLTHHYWTDERGVATKVNIIVGTTNNYAPISMSIKKAAMNFIKSGTVVTEGLLNRVEIRASDVQRTHCQGRCRWKSKLPTQMEKLLTFSGNSAEIELEVAGSFAPFFQSPVQVPLKL